MRRSFIAPRKKPFLSLFSKVWIAFILLTVAFLLLFNGYIAMQVGSFKEEMTRVTQKRLELERGIEEDEARIGLILRQRALSEEIFSNNTLLKESMKNLFDLVPDQITLKKVHMERNALVLYGITPTKDTFNFLLAAPLKSIFHTSQTTFYLTPQGWYNFVSVNKIIPQEGSNESF